MILTGIEELQKLLPSINLRLDSNRLDDFTLRAQQWVGDNIIGSDLEDILEIDILPNAPDDHEKLRLLVKRVIAAKAYLMFGDEMNLQLGEAGMVVQNNEAMSAASVQRRDNLMNSLEERLDCDCDALVNYLLKNSESSSAPYDYWRGTDQFTYLTCAFTPTLKALKIGSPKGKNEGLHWEQFYGRLSNADYDMVDLAGNYVSQEEIRRLRELYRDHELTTVQYEAVASLRCVAAGIVADDRNFAIRAAIRVRDIMLANLGDFPCFASSDCVTLPDVSFNAGHIVDTL